MCEESFLAGSQTITKFTKSICILDFASVYIELTNNITRQNILDSDELTKSDCSLALWVPSELHMIRWQSTDTQSDLLSSCWSQKMLYEWKEWAATLCYTKCSWKSRFSVLPYCHPWTLALKLCTNYMAIKGRTKDEDDFCYRQFISQKRQKLLDILTILSSALGSKCNSSWWRCWGDEWFSVWGRLCWWHWISWTNRCSPVLQQVKI